MSIVFGENIIPGIFSLKICFQKIDTLHTVIFAIICQFGMFHSNGLFFIKLKH